MKNVASVLLVMLVVASFVGSIGSGAEASADFTLRITHTHHEDGQYYKGSVMFKELVEERSGGRIVVEHYPSGQLGADRDIQEAVQMGIIEAGLSSSPVVLLNDYFKILDAPYLLVNRDHVTKVLDGPIGQRLAKPLEDVGIKHLAYWENGYRQISNNIRPIYTPADLQGIMLRTPESPVRMQLFKQLGANPVPMPFTELFGALQQGIVDGQENPLLTTYQASFQEVQKYISISNHVYSPVHLLLNKGFYDSMPADLQELVVEAAKEVAVWTRELGAENDASLIQKFLDAGVEVNDADVSSFVDAASPVWQLIIDDVRYDDAGEIIEEIVSLGK